MKGFALIVISRQSAEDRYDKDNESFGWLG